ncbi:unnamed protein product [Nesidiocoris tenuis]|uniref:Uncharacterized protein n=1 Tax=Nesidiocoris tenuis TaxID=355587 RepID=A0A6H5GD72_9HEMI|nr:unnamed protein product [Nesidiocoris tenuis]
MKLKRSKELVARQYRRKGVGLALQLIALVHARPISCSHSIRHPTKKPWPIQTPVCTKDREGSKDSSVSYDTDNTVRNPQGHLAGTKIVTQRKKNKRGNNNTADDISIVGLMCGLWSNGRHSWPVLQSSLSGHQSEIFQPRILVPVRLREHPHRHAPSSIALRSITTRNSITTGSTITTGTGDRVRFDPTRPTCPSGLRAPWADLAISSRSRRRPRQVTRNVDDVEELEDEVTLSSASSSSAALLKRSQSRSNERTIFPCDHTSRRTICNRINGPSDVEQLNRFKNNNKVDVIPTSLLQRGNSRPMLVSTILERTAIHQKFVSLAKRRLEIHVLHRTYPESGPLLEGTVSLRTT